MKTSMRLILSFLTLATVVMVVWSCSFSTPHSDDEEGGALKVERIDQLEYRFLTTGDYSALQQMNMSYPTETRTLLENVLRLGTVNDRGINDRFLKFFQDTTLQTVLTAVSSEFVNVNDVEKRLAKGFGNLMKLMPNSVMPTFYMQVGALGQSIIVGNDNSIGICLDKYLGEDFEVYKRYYHDSQRQQMTRSYIVPDCLMFYLISKYPLQNFETTTQQERDLHIARLKFVINKLLGENFYTDVEVKKVAQFYASQKTFSLKDVVLMGTGK